MNNKTEPCRKEANCPDTAMCRRLYKYICFFRYRSAKQPYKDLSIAFDMDWTRYVEEVSIILNSAPCEVEALIKADGNAEQLTEREISVLYQVSERIFELDEETPDEVFLPPDKK